MIGVGINLNFAEFIRACKMNIITWQYFKRFIYIYKKREYNGAYKYPGLIYFLCVKIAIY